MNKIIETLTKLEKARNDFAEWYNSNHVGSTDLRTFLTLDLLYQIGVFQKFFLAKNLLVTIYVNTYDIIIVRPELLPYPVALIANPNYDDKVSYIAYRKYDNTNSYEETVIAAYIKTLQFLNSVTMKITPY